MLVGVLHENVSRAPEYRGNKVLSPGRVAVSLSSFGGEGQGEEVVYFEISLSQD